MAVQAKINFCQRTVGKDSLPGDGPVILVKRPVRIRTQGVGAEEAPRLPDSGIIFLFGNLFPPQPHPYLYIPVLKVTPDSVVLL